MRSKQIDPFGRCRAERDWPVKGPVPDRDPVPAAASRDPRIAIPLMYPPACDRGERGAPVRYKIPGMKLRRRWKALIAGIVLGLLAVGGCVVASRDEPPPDVSDLAVERQLVADEENGFRFFADAPEPREVLPDDGSGEAIEPGDPFTEDWNPDLARRFVDGNRELLERLEKCLAAPKFQVPVAADVEADVRYLRSMREAVQVARRQAVLRFETGDEARALDDALQIVRLGGRVQSGDGVLIVYLVGLAIEDTGLDLLRRFAGKTRLADEDVLRRLAAVDRPEQLEASEKALRSSYKHEYLCLSSTVVAVARDADAARLLGDLGVGVWHYLPQELVLKPSQTQRFLAEYFRGLLEWQGPWSDPPAPLGLKRPLPSLEFRTWIPTNALGKRICATSVYYQDHVLEVHGTAHIARSSPAVLFALRRYQRDRGGLPGKLDDLVPSYLARVPTDPFDAQPLKYSRDKKVVYTVGSGGRNPDGDDEALTWKLEP